MSATIGQSARRSLYAQLRRQTWVPMCSGELLTRTSTLLVYLSVRASAILSCPSRPVDRLLHNSTGRLPRRWQCCSLSPPERHLAPLVDMSELPASIFVPFARSLDGTEGADASRRSRYWDAAVNLPYSPSSACAYTAIAIRMTPDVVGPYSTGKPNAKPPWALTGPVHCHTLRRL